MFIKLFSYVLNIRRIFFIFLTIRAVYEQQNQVKYGNKRAKIKKKLWYFFRYIKIIDVNIY